MKKVMLQIDDSLYLFYKKVGERADRLPENVMKDALIKVAGHLALRMMDEKEKELQ